jgi:hypothetical protein
MAGAVYGNASHGALTVTTAATVITDSTSTTAKPLGNRTNIVIYNNDTNGATLYLGFGATASTVTTSTGFPVPAGSSIDLDYGPQIVIYGISTASISVRYAEAY